MSKVLNLCLKTFVTKFLISGTIHSHNYSHLILDLGSAYYGDAGGGFAPSSVIGVGRSRIQDQVAVAVAAGGGGAVAVAGLTKRFLNHIHKNFLINVWGYMIHLSVPLGSVFSLTLQKERPM